MGYNANDRRLTQIRWAKVPNPTTAADRLQDYNYQRDVLNRLTRVEELTYGSGGTVTANHTWDATHDDADRLESFVTVAGSSSGTPTYDYTYDEADNRGVSVLDGVTQTPTHNSLNQIATLNGTTFTYDNSGNLLTDGDFTYKWDAENRLIEAKEPGINGKTFTYQFDGLNRRLRMARSGTGALGKQRTRTFFWRIRRNAKTPPFGGVLFVEVLEKKSSPTHHSPFRASLLLAVLAQSAFASVVARPMPLIHR